mmetsp:Transcript_9702/g.25404  ORF Transcript_9702/g.25404 Transcript_9702/m.25404 type:complete len:263 (-) Transcript_9702:455-1243(-)
MRWQYLIFVQKLLLRHVVRHLLDGLPSELSFPHLFIQDVAAAVWTRHPNPEEPAHVFRRPVFVRVPFEPGVVIYVPQHRLLVHGPRSQAGVEAAKRKLHLAGAVVRRRGAESLGLLGREQRNGAKHDQHHQDDSSGGQVRQLLAHTTFRVWVEFVVGAVVRLVLLFAIQRHIRCGALRPLAMFVDRLVQLHDAYDPNYSDQAGSLPTDLRCLAAPRLLRNVVVFAELVHPVEDPVQIEDQGGGGNQVQEKKKTEEVVIFAYA